MNQILLVLSMLVCSAPVCAGAAAQKSCYTSQMRAEMKPFLMPSDHPAKPVLDSIFGVYGVTEDIDSMKRAGFEAVSFRPFTFLVVTRHPSLPGYLQKMYFESEKRVKQQRPGWQWLVRRCQGAKNVRDLIREKKLKHFKAPRKWLYRLPQKPFSCSQPVILLVEDMQLVGQLESDAVWKGKLNHEILDELYVIISHGFASSHIGWNIPYSKDGRFACIDTEHPKRKPNYEWVKLYLSKEMARYWDSLVKNGGPKK